MKITISRRVNGAGHSEDEYILGENGKALSFATVKEAINYLLDRNYTPNDLRILDFNVGRGKTNTTKPDDPNWLTATETARYADIGRTTFYDWIKEGKLPFRSRSLAPRIRRFYRPDIDRWLKSISREPGMGPVFPRKRKKEGRM
jgi:excisionase family DNA binding protein